ncbi:MAG: hypothetical protein KatS3mg111_2366 [Pirellulaceae bacterium]|nr:MAG: hypothetical protein KatS3mg111_2366 [Pirellulaceae bacterium]
MKAQRRGGGNPSPASRRKSLRKIDFSCIADWICYNRWRVASKAFHQAPPLGSEIMNKIMNRAVSSLQSPVSSLQSPVASRQSSRLPHRLLIAVGAGLRVAGVGCGPERVWRRCGERRESAGPQHVGRPAAHRLGGDRRHAWQLSLRAVRAVGDRPACLGRLDRIDLRVHCAEGCPLHRLVGRPIPGDVDRVRPGILIVAFNR